MAEQMHAKRRIVGGEARNQLSEPRLTNHAGPFLHLPVRTDAHDVLRAIPEFLEVVGQSNHAALARATLFGVVGDFAEELTPFLVAQRRDSRLGVVGMAGVDGTAFAGEQLAELRLEGVDGVVVVRLRRRAAL